VRGQHTPTHTTPYNQIYYSRAGGCIYFQKKFKMRNHSQRETKHIIFAGAIFAKETLNISMYTIQHTTYTLPKTIQYQKNKESTTGMHRARTTYMRSNVVLENNRTTYENNRTTYENNRTTYENNRTTYTRHYSSRAGGCIFFKKIHNYCSRSCGYGVPTICRLLKTISLFCKKSPMKKTIFCKRDLLF